MKVKDKEKRIGFRDLIILLVFSVIILTIHYIIKIFLEQQIETNYFYAFLPYLIDLILIIALFLEVKFSIKKKIKDISKIAIWIPFLDIVVNFLIFLIGLFLNVTNDFTLIFKSGNGIFAVALVILADYFWWKTINTK